MTTTTRTKKTTHTQPETQTPMTTTTKTKTTTHTLSKNTNAAAPAAAETQSNPSAPAPVTVNQAPPPADAHIPSPPAGYTPSGNSIFLGVLPRLIELGALRGAVDDLKAFSDYDAIFGNIAPPLAELVEALDLADQWSTMRKSTQVWDDYAQMEEGIAWATARPLLVKLQAAFLLLAVRNPSLRSRFPSLTTLLTAKQAIARKGVATKALNRQAKAEGKPPIHGKAGKRRKKAADKAIVAAATAGVTQAVTPATPAAPPATQAAPAPAAPAGGNGTAHS